MSKFGGRWGVVEMKSRHNVPRYEECTIHYDKCRVGLSEDPGCVMPSSRVEGFHGMFVMNNDACQKFRLLCIISTVIMFQTGCM